MNKKSRAVILARVSSKSQEDEGYSLDSQVKLLTGYCANKGFIVDKIFKIAETASKEQSRRIFKELLTYMNKNAIYHLAVEKTDRLTRNMKDAVAIDDWLSRDADRMLHLVKENIQLHKESKSDVKFMWNIHLAVAKKYTDNLREEAMKGWAEKLAQGWQPSRPPYGYMTAMRAGKRIHVPDPRTAPVIKKAFELYLNPSESTITIWAFLKQAGITTFNGRPLSKSAAHKLLLNTYYMGIITFNNETYAGSHEPIISKQLFNQVQDKLHGKRPSQQKKHDIVLRNFIRCDKCDKAITWQKQKGRLYGACQRDLPECKAHKFLREEVAHEALIERLDELISPSPEVTEWLINHLGNEFQSRHDAADKMRREMQTRIARLNSMEEMLYDDKLAGDISKERYEAKKKDIQKQREDLKDQLSVGDISVEENHVEMIDIIELTQRAKSCYLDEELTNESKRTILTKLFDDVVYNGSSVSVKLTDFAETVANCTGKMRDFLEVKKELNQTTKYEQNDRGQEITKDLIPEILPYWQG